MKKQAFIIIAHGSLDILNKLLELLDSKYFDIFLHLDIKSNIKVADIYKCSKSKFYIFKKYDIRWGDYSMIETELYMLEQSRVNGYEYYHIISGVDLPIKSNKYIYEFFHNNYPKEFVRFDEKETMNYKIDWIKYYHNMEYSNYYKYATNTKTNNDFFKSDELFVKKQKQDGVDRLKGDPNVIKCGANWVSITLDLLEYILSKKTYIEERFRYTRCCDEFFVQTLVYNSPFKERLYYQEEDGNYEACMRLVDWKRGGPYVWGINDYDEIINSDKLLARKFDSNIDYEIIDKIYEYVKDLNNKEEEN